MGKILASIGAISTICVVAACGSTGGKTHTAAASHSTSATPSASASASPTASPKAWWIIKVGRGGNGGERVFHGTETAAMNSCTSCNLSPDGPYPSKAAAERHMRATLAAERQAKARAHRAYLHRTVAYRTDRIVYTVVGSGYPSVQYGTDSNTVDVPGGNGPLGDGVALPFFASQHVDNSALWYDVTAQLEGGGDITATVADVQRTVYKDGHSVVHRQLLAHAHAAGGYAIANAQYNNSGF